ncbi:MAG TPA: outer membrane beta-barrel protein, partial [Chitinophagaceae bacterium]|nr:outer membrane beta-barrel protein [Chitinophagaceae bacterium]
FQYMFDNGFRIEAGPQVGFLIGAEGEAADGSQSNNINMYKNVDFGLGVGLNYLFYSGWGLGGRYNFGLSNIKEVNTTKTQNRVFQLSVFRMLDKQHKAKSR